jgi:glycosyltransferase involved in cell wall biosynthesis
MTGGLRILLVTHELSRTGAPAVALLVTRALVDAGHTVTVVSRRPGPLRAGFAAVAPTRVEPWHRVRRRLLDLPRVRGVAARLDELLAWVTVARARPDLVYVNSVAAAAYMRPARWAGARVVLHVHESTQVVLRLRGRAGLGDLTRDVQLVACSPSVRDDLEASSDGSRAGVTLLPSVPDAARVLEQARRSPADDPYPGEVVVGCCGSVEHRKGADLWVEAARRVLRSLPGVRVRFVWVGDLMDPPEVRPGEPIEFVGPVPDPAAHIRRFDVATLPSRDDPFPLVVLESMLLGRPVVAFDVGGVAEQLGDTGLLIPPGDVAAFAAAVARLVREPETRTRLGARAADRARTEFSTAAFSERVCALVTGSAVPEEVSP